MSGELPLKCKDCTYWYGAEDDEVGPCSIKNMRGDKRYMTIGRHACDEGFFAKEMRFRRMMHYPPHTALVNIILQDEKLERAARLAKLTGEFFAGADTSRLGIRVLGPSPAPLAKIEGRYRIQFLLKAVSRARLNDRLRRLLDEFEHLGISPRSYVLDVDPVNIM